ncbi:MAG: hypothetical protein Q9227_003056 [Pyrenula ochraceoflavens]
MQLSVLIIAAFGIRHAVGLPGASSSQGSLPGTVTISASGNAPSSTTDKIDKSFLGFGIETQSLPDYAAEEASRQLMQNIQIRTNGPTIVRVGGTSLDNIKRIDTNQKAPVTGAQQGWNVPFNITLSPAWFERFGGWPSEVKFIIDVPLLGPQGPRDIGLAQQFLTLALKYVGSNLHAVEIGNEPDLYQRGKEDPAEYAKLWHTFADSLQPLLNGHIQSKPYQALALSGAPQDTSKAKGTPRTNATNWALTSGWFDKTNNFDYSLISSVSMHYYQTTSGGGNLGSRIQELLMDHSKIVQKTNLFRPSIDYVKQHGMDFVMGEVGSSYNGKTGKRQNDDFGLEAVLGSALWTVDWMLYAMSVGVVRVNMQLGVNFAYAAWQPVATDTNPVGHQLAMVSAPYYAFLIVGDFIGKEPDVRMAELPEINKANKFLAGYAAYAGGKLVRIAIVNLLECKEGSSDCPRQNMQIQVPDGAQGFKIMRLTGPGDKGTQAKGEEMSYDNTKYTWLNGGRGEPSGLKQEDVTVDGKTAKFTIRASEAVLLSVQSS